MTIRFTVLGLAQPAGSKRAFAVRRADGSLVTGANGSPVINVSDANPKAKSWQQEVRSAARQAYSGELLAGPLQVTMTFFVPRPKGHYGTGRNAAHVRDSAPPFPSTRPDVLKLARGTEDALSKILYVDDEQTVDLILRKRFGEPARCEIEVVELVASAQPAAEQERLFQTEDVF